MPLGNYPLHIIKWLLLATNTPPNGLDCVSRYDPTGHSCAPLRRSTSAHAKHYANETNHEKANHCLLAWQTSV